MIISNNLVWKYNKDNEYPKAIFRAPHSVILRDRTQAIRFFDMIDGFTNDQIEEYENAVQFASSVTDATTTEDDLRFIFITPTNVRFTIYLLLYKTDKLGNMTRYYVTDVDSNIKDAFCDFGINLVSAIKKHVSMAKPRIEQNAKEKEFNTGFFQRVKNLFSISECNPKTCQTRMYFDAVNDINLNEIVLPIMDKYVYDKKIKHTELELLKSLTMVISIRV